MLLCQAQGNCAGPRRVVQIYATDLNPQAIAVARKGWFSESAMAGVTLEQRTRFFTPHQGGHVVSPEIRSMVMFAKHDVITDPPFTQLDLLMCRNVLIYFSATLQRRLIPLFHFSLRAGGALVLGSAETVGRSSHLFTTLAPKSRLYARREAPLNPGSVAFPVHHRPAPPSAIKDPSVNSAAPTSVDNLQTLADRVLLDGFSPAAVLVNAAGDILYINGRTGPYMEAATGKANWNLHVMLRPALRGPVALALRQALSERRSVVLNSLPLEGHIQRQLQVTVQALDDSSAWMNTAMVIFKEVDMNVLPEGVVGTAVGEVSIELQAAQLELQALQLEMQTSKNELGAINGALKVANEELQVANEELTTSKEESQSMNEELQTINSELQTRLDDLALAQSDMQNLLNSTDIATLFLDNDLNVRRYTEQAVGIFHLRESDVGRPLSDLASILTYPHLQADVKETLRALTPCTKSVAATDGRWFSVRIMPYRTLANAVSGAVLTFVDISTAKALEFRLRESHLPETPSKDAP
jgi:two-component system CheB/CheR fusion protein